MKRSREEKDGRKEGKKAKNIIFIKGIFVFF